ncbi:DUF4910 domain-containing protein [Tumebacillus flagellatus]|uniref:Peptidase M28 domain-containing protein n=1 Tax=Tumebacillus flagellatus TaxID=1157490 RepID=A0A074MAQ8_9BACL|nr:DUF4910 domain-containing protein [Tumebacillus flagellatus]KEO83002.1 hypothetical protein EL26_11975 [Tumebacillus flagellatus]
MLNKWLAPFQAEASGEAALNHARVISTHHRIQASPGYREAAQYCVNRLREYGLDAEIVSYPATPDVYFGNSRSFREWRCQEAELQLLHPVSKRLARYTEMELSVIQRSTATPPEGVTAELVLVENAVEEAGYQGIDVRGKLVLARGSQMRIHQLAVEKFGALGIVTDNMTAFPPLRTREDLADAVQYTSFWWYDESLTSFGFAVSPRVGDELRALCKKGPVTVRARVEAQLLEGQIENVEAFIPGETDEEVLLVSHLCHPKPGGNDNASGPSVLLETARTLQRLIREGRVAKPRRGIRFLLMPEFTGTHAHINHRQERLARTVAALNLDMVGADPAKSGGPLTVVKSSRSLPSYTAELAYGIWELAAEDCRDFNRTFGYSLTNHLLTPFSPGSDHYILADPTVGIPCPMMITWPDKFYHTSFDTVDNLSPQMMGRVASTAAAYLYWVSNAELPDLLALASRMAANLAQELEVQVRSVREGLIEGALAAERLLWLKDCKIADLRSLQRLVLAEDEERFQSDLAKKITFVEAVCEHFAAELESLLQASAQTLAEVAATTAEAADPLLQKVFRRRGIGPLDLNGFLRQLTPEEREAWVRAQDDALHDTGVFVQYYMDGKRTLAEILKLAELETDKKDVPFSLAFIRLLQRLDLIEEVTAE